MNLYRIPPLGFVAFVFILFGQPPRIGVAFERETHKAITQRAVKEPGLNFLNVLNRLGFSSRTTGDTISSDTLAEFERGADREDGSWEYDPRPKAHFHDPTLPMDQAGLSVSLLGVPLRRYPSASFWAQDAPPEAGGAFGDYPNDKSWHDARSAYYYSLVDADPLVRDQRLSETFVILGHLAGC